ncbi:MAG: hypothetical protein OZSIB_1654 [Candidatus Ozemobacter sibiricus]|uniref:Uncharacterized protein n=1 Tax=Candidatus Ozemobacter sibiricus TaxID=2268124 RepID=A0A367ZK92_9BACT|nr:MAG: hypothetical protein OZSIB_1654 [Candidatus Ozemobacter sibiricus]
MMKRRHGLALPLVGGFAAFLALIVFAVMRLSSSEMRWTQQSALQKQAAMLAFSGINVAEMALAKGRWYQPPFRSPVDLNKDGVITRAEAEATSLISRPNFSEMEFTPEGGEGRVRIFFQEVPKRNVNLTGNLLYARFKLQTADLLDHIKVYSVGECRGERVMVYGKFIMSPSPLLNTPDIDLASSTSVPVSIYRVWVEPPQLVEEQIAQGYTPFKHGKIKAVNKSVGDRVGPNDTLFTIADNEPSHIAAGWLATQEANPKAAVHGKIISMTNPATGQPWKVGDTVDLPCEMAVIEEDANVGSDIPSQTLKRMVMILQIPNEFFADCDLEIGAAETYRVLNRIGSYTRGVAREFVMRSANKELFEAEVPRRFESAFPSVGSAGTAVSDARIIQVLDSIGPLPTTDYNKAGNTFILDMLRKWRPRGFDLTPDEAANIQNLASFALGVRETDPRETCKEIYSICQQFSEWKLVDSPPPPDRGPNSWRLFSVWKPKYPGPDGFPTQYPLRSTWEYFERTLARTIRETLYPNVPPGSNISPPYVFGPGMFKNPTEEFLNFRDFTGKYSPFGARADGGFSSFLANTPPDEFVRRLAILKNAAKRVTFTFMRWIPWQDWDYQDMIDDYLNGNPLTHNNVVGFAASNYWPWWGDPRQICADPSKFRWPPAKAVYGSETFGAKGWPDQLRHPKGDPKGAHIDPSTIRPTDLVQEVDVPYTYELKFKNGTGIRTRLDYLLDYFRKYFDEPELNPDAKRIRGANEQTDTPQVPGPPDLLGASYTGLSS